MSEDQALSLIEKVIKQSEAEGVFISLSTGEEALSRFSSNQISQNISSTQFNLTITSYFGTRSARASTTDMNPEAIAAAIQRSESLARIAPEDPEWVPLLEPQTEEQRIPAFDEATATLLPLARGEIVQRVCALSAKADVNGSGILSTEAFLRAVGNSRGMRACNQGTEANFSFTARIGDGSSWSHRTAFAVNQLPVESLTKQTVERAMLSLHPREVSPGTAIANAPATEGKV